MPDPKLNKWRNQSDIDAEKQAAAAEQQRIANLKGDAVRQQLVDQLKVATPTQINNYVDANVTDLPSARTMFKRILLVMSTIVRD